MDKICLLLHFTHGTLIVTSVSITIISMSICIILLVITADKKVNQMNSDLYYREELFNTLGSNVDDVFIIYASNNKSIEYVSPNFEKSLGLSHDILNYDHQRLLEFVPTRERAQILEVINSPLQTESKQVEFEFDPLLSGKKHWISIRVYPASSISIRRYVICISDITKDKEAQIQVREALENVKKANEAKKEFLSHMSHEIKTPINAIIGMTQIAQKAIEDKEKVMNCLNKIDFASIRLLEMINNILDMSKIDSCKLMLIHEPFSISELLTQFTSLMANQAELQNKDFNLFLNNLQDYNLIGDSTRLYQILGNCISNSLKFTPAGGKIELEVSETVKTDEIVRIRFIIKDNGIGMSDEFMERLFIPFDQEDSNISRKCGGTGLGMPIAKNLVQLMGGSIAVTSKKNIGTTVSIEIPFDINNVIKRTIQNEATAIPKKTDYSGKRILIIEDNEINREITCEFLEYLKIKVETVSNGYEAIELFEKSSPGYYDAILMDIKMPGLNGYETTAAIRKSSRPDAKTICIIAMTADNFAEEHLSFDSGMNYHITKPIDIDYFCSLLHNILEEA